ncbi:MAG: nitroreductase family protein [Bacteroides sp.]|nr:nitroreductase family protein [Prevotella sp.]MCM1407642.1 nitroreductase family protein [Treponema brennaborense]MCM1469208.1 nitroreductase family protein [Bacteroides sp.]
MNQTIETILRRRSCRAFTGAPVSEQDIRTVLDCALAAPSGMGKQTWRFTAVINKDKIRQLAAAVAAALSRGPEYTMYDPDVLIITSNEKNSKFREVDNACAMENIYLACESLNLGCVWINQLLDCYDDPAVRAVLTEFGIPENHGVYGCAAIGHKGGEPKEKEIKGSAVIVH